MADILADDILKCIFLNENDRIPIQISLTFVLRSPIDNTAALVQVMAWRRTGWINDDPVHWRIYAALGEHELFLWVARNLTMDLMKSRSREM